MIYSSRISLVVKSKQVVNCLNTAPYICMSSSRYVTCAILVQRVCDHGYFQKANQKQEIINDDKK